MRRYRLPIVLILALAFIAAKVSGVHAHLSAHFPEEDHRHESRIAFGDAHLHPHDHQDSDHVDEKDVEVFATLSKAPQKTDVLAVFACALLIVVLSTDGRDPSRLPFLDDRRRFRSHRFRRPLLRAPPA